MAMATMKTSTEDPDQAAARIRDNQRRSRARRREYLEDVQKKLHEYERRGVEATLEMQQAARRVAAENRGLRALLKRHGVADEETEAFLQTFVDVQEGEAAVQTVPAMPAKAYSPLAPANHGTAPSLDVETATPKKACDSTASRKRVGDLVSLAPAPPPKSNNRMTYRELQPLVTEPRLPLPLPQPSSEHQGSVSKLQQASHSHSTSNTNDSCCNGKTQCTVPSETRPLTPEASPSTTATMESPRRTSETESGDADAASPLIMSCTAAALIMTQMHSGMDVGQAKTALGCEGQAECMVRNTTLFQCMD